eukprot:sb/3479758/
MANLNRSFNHHNRNRISRGGASKSFNHHDKHSVRHHRGYYSEPLPRPSFSNSYSLEKTYSYPPSHSLSTPYSFNTSYFSPPSFSLSSGWCPREEGVDKPTVMIHYMPHRTFETPIVCTCVRTLRGSMPDLSTVSNKKTSNKEFMQSVRDVYALSDALGKSCPTHPRDHRDEKTRKSDQVRKMLLKPLRALRKKISGKPTVMPESFVVRVSKEPCSRFEVTPTCTLLMLVIFFVLLVQKNFKNIMTVQFQIVYYLIYRNPDLPEG